MQDSPLAETANVSTANRPLRWMVIWLMSYWLVTAVAPLNRHDWALENILVVVYAVILVTTYRRFRFSNTSYVLLTLFFTLHLTGAHYTYAEVPLGYWLQEWFDLQRNHFDRIVHFSYGFLLAYPFRELLIRVGQIKEGWSYFVAVNMVLAFSGFFEIAEMWIAMLVSPDLGDAYLGTQGDIWDAQQDMFLAFIGASITMGSCWLFSRVRQATVQKR